MSGLKGNASRMCESRNPQRCSDSTLTFARIVLRPQIYNISKAVQWHFHFLHGKKRYEKMYAFRGTCCRVGVKMFSSTRKDALPQRTARKQHPRSPLMRAQQPEEWDSHKITSWTQATTDSEYTRYRTGRSSAYSGDCNPHRSFYSQNYLHQHTKAVSMLFRWTLNPGLQPLQSIVHQGCNYSAFNISSWYYRIPASHANTLICEWITRVPLRALW